MASCRWRWALMNTVISMARAQHGGMSDSFPHWALFLNVSQCFAQREGRIQKRNFEVFSPLFCIFRFTEKLRRRARAPWNYMPQFSLFCFSFGPCQADTGGRSG